jgi:hypothetical protein
LCANERKISIQSFVFLEAAQTALAQEGSLAVVMTDRRKTQVRVSLLNLYSGGNDGEWRIFGGSSPVDAE